MGKRGGKRDEQAKGLIRDTDTALHKELLGEDQQPMTPEEAVAFMDEWAAEESKIQKQKNTDRLVRELEHAERRGINWRDEGGLQRAADALVKDAIRGAKVLSGAEEGGQERRRQRKGPPDEVLCAKVLERHERNPHLSYTEACEQTGRDYGLSGRTVRRRLPDLQWAQR